MCSPSQEEFIDVLLKTNMFIGYARNIEDGYLYIVYFKPFGKDGKSCIENGELKIDHMALSIRKLEDQTKKEWTVSKQETDLFAKEFGLTLKEDEQWGDKNYMDGYSEGEPYSWGGISTKPRYLTIGNQKYYGLCDFFRNENSGEIEKLLLAHEISENPVLVLITKAKEEKKINGNV